MGNKIVRFAISLGVGLMGFGLSAQTEKQPAAMTIPVCEAPPRLDTDLKDPAWNKALKVTGFYQVGGKATKPAEVQTTAWLCRDPSWLYIAFRCDETKAGAVRCSATERDPVSLSDDAVEVFLDPGTAGAKYYHFVLTVGNIQADQVCEGAVRNRAWDLPWRSAAQLDPHIDSATGWSAEMAIPLAPLQAEAGTNAWRMNLGRARYATTPAEFSSWNALPPYAGFHSPSNFVPVQGLNESKALPVFGPMLRGVTLNPLNMTGDCFVYDVQAVMRNEGGQAGAVEVVLKDLPQIGNGTQQVQTVALKAGASQTVSFHVNIAGLGRRAATVGLREPGAANWFQQTAVTGLDLLSLFDAYVERNYYTMEDEGRVWAELKLAPQSNLVFQADILNDKGRAIASAQVVGQDTDVALSLSLKKLMPGVYRVRTVLGIVHPERATFLQRMLGRSAIQPLGSMELRLVKQPPALQGCNEVKIDRYNRCLLLNGRPFFPVGAWGPTYQPPLNNRAKEYLIAQFRYGRDSGLNFIFGHNGYGSERSADNLRWVYDQAYSNGLYVGAMPYDCANRDLWYDSPKFRETALATIKTLDPFLAMCRRHPAVIGYMHFDEPTYNLTVDDILQALKDKVNRLDPYHPISMSLCRYVHNPRWFGTITDLLGVHNYWYVMKPKTFNACIEYFALYDQQARQAHAPAMMTPQIDYWGADYDGGGFMTPVEQRAQTYMALILGARWITYFTLPWNHQEGVATQAKLSAEIQALTPALLSREPRQTLTFAPDDAVVPVNTPVLKLPLVLTSLRQFPTGEQVLLALNTLPDSPITVQFAVSSLSTQSRVTGCFDKRNYPVKDGKFTDTLEPFGTRAYRLTRANQAQSHPVQIGVSMSQFTKAPADSPAETPAQKNLIKNSSFEQARVIGFPDWWANTWPDLYLVPDERALGLEAREPYHGKYCYRVVKNFPDETVFAFPNPVSFQAGKQYTLSLYMRAKDNGQKAIIYATMAKPYENQVALDTAWKRYSVTYTATQTGQLHPFQVHLQQPGTIYLDAVQLEEGPVATEYEP